MHYSRALWWIASVVGVAAESVAAPAVNDSILFAFTDGDYTGYQTWDWQSITHLGFWTKPSDDVRELAKTHQVKLFHDCSVPNPKDWLNSSKRAEFAESCASDVRQHKWDGVFFDFEGNGLSRAEQSAYVLLAQETTAALAPLGAKVFVCVGGRPSYELRNYDYVGLANATDFLFVMGYDLHFWDDYTCMETSQGNVCSAAEASIRTLTAGLDEYLRASVPAEKLVLGLPWYGQRYTHFKLGPAPFNEGQIDYKDVLAAFDSGIVTNQTKDQDSLSWRIECRRDCLDGGKGRTVWYDDAETLAPKFKLAGQRRLRGVGMWHAGKLPLGDAHVDERKAMWSAITSWRDDATSA